MAKRRDRERELRVLFVADTKEGRRIMSFFKEHQIRAAVCVNPTDPEFRGSLPLLITSSGQWFGVKELNRYMSTFK